MVEVLPQRLHLLRNFHVHHGERPESDGSSDRISVVSRGLHQRLDGDLRILGCLADAAERSRRSLASLLELVVLQLSDDFADRGLGLRSLVAKRRRRCGSHLVVRVLEGRLHFGKQVCREIGVNQILDGRAAIFDLGTLQVAAGFLQLLGLRLGTNCKHDVESERQLHVRGSGKGILAGLWSAHSVYRAFSRGSKVPLGVLATARPGTVRTEFRRFRLTQGA